MVRRGSTRRLGIGIAAAAAGLALAAPSASPAAVTIGGDTTPTGSYAVFQCSSISNTTCLFAQLSNPARTIASPLDGVIVRWRVVGDSLDTQFKLRVVRPLGSGLYTGAGSSDPETVAPDAERVFDTQLAVEEGDLIGIDVRGQDVIRAPAVPGIRALAAASSTVGRWDPTLVDGETPGRAPTPEAPQDYQLQLNADVEPDCDGDGLGDETRDPDTASCNPAPPVPQCNGKQPTIVGTEGNDVLVGTNKKNVIAALGGDDQVKAKNGKDVVCGGDGNDLLKGGNGRDQLNGEDGTDTCKGGRGKDKGTSCETSGKIP